MDDRQTREQRAPELASASLPMGASLDRRSQGAHQLTSWSWSQLLAAAGGDDELALEQLALQDGLGQYQDETHRRAALRGPRSRD